MAAQRSLALALAVLAQVVAQGAASLRADALMMRRGLSNLEEAARLYERALEDDPGNLDLRLKLADALNGVMRVKTNSNTLVIDKLLDTPANKAIWAKIGPRALEMAKEVQQRRPKDVRAAAVYADAYMFSSSSKGIVKQALAGAASVFKENANRLVRLDRRYDSGVGYALLGAFYTVAPWPMGDLNQAMKYMREALAVAPSRRNLYYVGVVAYKRKEWRTAVEHFERALRAKPGSPTEADFADFMRAESERALKLARAQLQKDELRR